MKVFDHDNSIAFRRHFNMHGPARKLGIAMDDSPLNDSEIASLWGITPWEVHMIHIGRCDLLRLGRLKCWRLRKKLEAATADTKSKE